MLLKGYLAWKYNKVYLIADRTYVFFSLHLTACYLQLNENVL